MKGAKKGLNPTRDQYIQECAGKGTKKWKQDSGYHARSLVESDIGALKALTGHTSRARTLEGATAEAFARVVLYNLVRARDLQTFFEAA